MFSSRIGLLWSMEMTFDPKTHRFGMAYMLHGFPCWPGDDIQFIRRENEYGICWYAADYKWWKNEAKNHLSRAPEHDLVPKAKADKLAQAARFVVKNLTINDTVFDKLSDALDEFERNEQ
jgi:hypothetical protein